LFIAAWFLQIALSFIQNRHYQQTVREMAHQGSGFLGVGVAKRRFGIGSVVILVTDRNQVVTQAQELTGVTVFGRFKPAADFIGRSLTEFAELSDQHSRQHAVKRAAEQIHMQVMKN
jgi:glucitol operon activator protein